MATRHLLITGANRGIGLGLVRLYLRAGWQVTAACRSPERAQQLLELTQDYPLEIVELDVQCHQAIIQLANDIQTPIHLLINNAGYYGPKSAAFGDTDAEQWMQVFGVNVIAVQKMAEAFLEHLQAANGAIIANISSKMGSMTDNQGGGSYLYRSSKAALNAVVKSQSIDLAPAKIASLAIHPGWVQTEMGGPNALITVEQSSAGIKQLLDGYHEQMNGGFFDYQGAAIAW
ncbi:SDR family oxidoreductase [Shewanella sp. NIFS-20-20]|uniref:SDR family oxidoreductase n=1 Tax=Shewanella sp. NIFS-20-20 TaxID=2853806 RepID=UPI001C47B5E7|nr:SDR family oxidoreductase [Shewanella sp. NIFS-20-20]MBV7316354.1 SDR family oxidoreductase [Shewanella sp. NIFS-20-20]